MTKQKLLAKATQTLQHHRQFQHWLNLVDIEQPETQQYTMEWLKDTIREIVQDTETYIEKLHKEEA